MLAHKGRLMGRTAQYGSLHVQFCMPAKCTFGSLLVQFWVSGVSLCICASVNARDHGFIRQRGAGQGQFSPKPWLPARSLLELRGCCMSLRVHAVPWQRRRNCALARWGMLPEATDGACCQPPAGPVFCSACSCLYLSALVVRGSCSSIESVDLGHFCRGVE